MTVSISDLTPGDLLSLTEDERDAAIRNVAPGQPGLRDLRIQQAQVKKTLAHLNGEGAPAGVPTMNDYIEANYRSKMAAAGRSAVKARMLCADDYRRKYGSRIQ